MKYFLFLSSVLFFSCQGGKKSGSEGQPPASPLPECVQKLIDTLGKQEPPDLPIKVDEYLYKGNTVYLFTADCCDRYDLLFDGNCQHLCAPSGGFTGGGDNKCPDFEKEAKLVKELWRNPKQKK